jgi:hypothetical protein
MNTALTTAPAGTVREETSMPNGPHRARPQAATGGAVAMVYQPPWWAGIPGLDPSRGYKGIRISARSAAIHCGIHVLGLGLQVRGDHPRWALRRNDAVGEVSKWYRWLAAAGNEADAVSRRMTLREVCGIEGLPAEHILPTAVALCEAAPYEPETGSEKSS